MSDLSVANGVMATGSTSLLWELMRVFFVLLLLLPLAYVATRFYVRKMHGVAGSGALKVIEVTPVGSGRSLVLVAVGRQLLVLGVTAQQINLITEISDPQEVERLLSKTGASDGKRAFSDVLRKVTNRQDSAEGENKID